MGWMVYRHKFRNVPKVLNVTLVPSSLISRQAESHDSKTLQRVLVLFFAFFFKGMDCKRGINDRDETVQLSPTRIIHQQPSEELSPNKLGGRRTSIAVTPTVFNPNRPTRSKSIFTDNAC